MFHKTILKRGLFKIIYILLLLYPTIANPYRFETQSNLTLNSCDNSNSDSSFVSEISNLACSLKNIFFKKEQ